jgi:hypothetical protein
LEAARGRIASTALSRDFRSWLAEQAVTPETLGPQGWWLRLFTDLQRVTTPLQHIVFQAYLRDRLRRQVD